MSLTPLFLSPTIILSSVLSQADADLYRLGRVLQLILPESYYSRSRRKEFQQQLQMLLQWQDDNARLFQDVLWHGAHKTYLSKCYNATTSEMEWIEDAVSNNLLAFWNVAAIEEESDLAQYNANDEDIIETTREQLKDLSMQLLRRDDKGELYSFDCGRFPLWSEGGCETGAEAISEQAGTRKWPVIQPVVNYLVASGLWRNSDLETFGRYMSEASLDLFCYQAAGIFGESFAVSAPYQNLANCDVCGNTSTATAAIVFNFLVPDAARAHRIPLPPIQRRWVITLITVELFVAFSIGVSCLILSFNLVRLNSTIIGGEPGEPSDAYDFNDDTGTQTYYDATSMTMPEDNSGQGGEEQPFLQANGKLS